MQNAYRLPVVGRRKPNQQNRGKAAKLSIEQLYLELLRLRAEVHEIEASRAALIGADETRVRANAGLWRR